MVARLASLEIGYEKLTFNACMLILCVGLNRTGKSCRLRWVNYLHPGLKRGRLTPQEERLVLELHARWGNRFGHSPSSILRETCSVKGISENIHSHHNGNRLNSVTKRVATIFFLVLHLYVYCQVSYVEQFTCQQRKQSSNYYKLHKVLKTYIEVINDNKCLIKEMILNLSSQHNLNRPTAFR